MSLVPNVGRKKWSIRLFIICVYTILSLMGLTMIIPFMITVSGSSSNWYDNERYWPIPRFIWSENDRFMRCLAPYFNDFNAWNRQLSCALEGIPVRWSTWGAIGRDIKNADKCAEKYIKQNGEAFRVMQIRAADYSLFAMDYPLTDCVVRFDLKDKVPFLKEYYGRKYFGMQPEKAAGMSSRQLTQAGLKCLNREWNIPFESYYDINFTSEIKAPMGQQGWFPPSMTPKYKVFLDLKEAYRQQYFSPGVKNEWRSWLEKNNYAYEEDSEIFPVGVDAPAPLKKLWRGFNASVAPASPVMPYALRAEWYKYLQSDEVANALKLTGSFKISDYNRLAGTSYSNLYKTPFPIPAAFKTPIRKIWTTFVLERYPLRLTQIKVNNGLHGEYQNFLKKKIKHLRVANELFNTKVKSWNEFKFSFTPLLGEEEFERNRRNMWRNFVRMKIPAEKRILTSSEIAYQKFLMGKYGSLKKINDIYNWNLKHIEAAFPPFMDAYTVTFTHNQTAMTWYPVFGNYATVFDFLLFNANAIPVTVLLIVLTLICTLTINPLAAYALSRFNIKGHDKILLFMLATMAFPAMVSAIPAYLLMRDLGLLNTFFALVLPGAANGMAIFILKGFFDSLPSELYEAATIDGAHELQIFRIIAMPMVKPILAINALNAFIAAYAGWAWALIICQDKSMWTISVWLYQVSSSWGSMPWLVTAGFVIASIPTAIAFLSCQKMILRGIIIPSMK